MIGVIAGIYKPGNPLQILKRVVFYTILASEQLKQDLGANAVLMHSNLPEKILKDDSS